MATVLGLSSGVLLVEAIAPQAVHAQTNQVSVSLQRQPNESFETLINRAEAAARATAQQNFASSATSGVAVTVLGESAGLVAPLLSLEVNRDNWRSRPDPQQWATYYSDARTLLGFESLAPATAAQPTPAVPTQPTADPNNPTTPEPTAQTPATTPATTIVIPPNAQVSPTTQPTSGTSSQTPPGNITPGEPQQAPGTPGTQPSNTLNQQPAGQSESNTGNSQQPALGDPSVGEDTSDTAPPTQNDIQQPEIGDPSVGDQNTTNEAPQTEVDTPGSVPSPGPVGVPEVYDPGPIGVPRSGVGK
ncbi:hypothetical protein H6G00_25195 [Leptolyngbya sp. FACHB-541]|uniref:hypothetical protein n=1 Tax=Leptolyngbya sp. FACHB-541 TaxID=2692810 RepID=UPI001681E685|nr:hypothetical protein [Leptolyngbya sp. FACHB-541]MBD1999865.1 hypothetical protein [Leptolyngbya sp. FACHB-541]